MNILSLLVLENFTCTGIGKCVFIKPMRVSLLRRTLYKFFGYSFYEIGLYSETQNVCIGCVAKTGTITVGTNVMFHCKDITGICFASKIKSKGI